MFGYTASYLTTLSTVDEPRDRRVVFLSKEIISCNPCYLKPDASIQVCKIMLGHGEIVGSCGLLCEDAYFVDEVGDELAPSDFEYLDWLSGSLEGRALSHPVACRPVAVDHVPSSS